MSKSRQVRPYAGRNIHLARALNRCRRTFCWVGLFSIIQSVLLLTLPLYMIQVYDRVLGSSSIDTLLMLTIIAIGALALLCLLEGLRQYILNLLASRFEMDLGGPLLVASAYGATKGQIPDIQVLRDLGQLRTFLTSSAVTSLFDLPLSPLFIVVVWLIHPLLGAVTAGGALSLLVLTICNQQFAEKPLRDSASRSIAALTTAQSFVQNAETVHAMGMQADAVTAWGENNAIALKAQMQATARRAVFTSLSRFARLTMQIAVLGLGGYLTIKHEITGGMIFASSVVAGRALQPIEAIIASWRGFIDSRKSYRRIKNTLASEAIFEQRHSLPPLAGHLKIEQLAYVANASGPPILRGITFEIAAGESLGIVGPAGAGKSTLARLIVGAIEPSSGTVRLDEVSLDQWKREDRGRSVGYMPQSVEFFPGTIARNIARMQLDVPEAQVIEAAQKAGVHEVIARMPNAYDTLIGRFGHELSGGQKQRIGLARAFFGNPRLLVLDEPNAHLDADGDAALARGLKQAKDAGATVIIVAQRPSAIQFVDKLLVLRDGTVQAFGPRSQILHKIMPAHSNPVPSWGGAGPSERQQTVAAKQTSNVTALATREQR